jgi:hypothetical protein
MNAASTRGVPIHFSPQENHNEHISSLNTTLPCWMARAFWCAVPVMPRSLSHQKYPGSRHIGARGECTEPSEMSEALLLASIEQDAAICKATAQWTMTGSFCVILPPMAAHLPVLDGWHA